MIKAGFAQNLGILRVSDIMAYSRLSVDDVVSTIFADEESFDDSDSESGEDIYGYLGAFSLCRGELEEESRNLTGGVDETEDRVSSEDSLSNKEERLGETLDERDMEQSSHPSVENTSGNEGDANGGMLPEVESLAQHSDETNDMEVVSELKIVLIHSN